MTSRTSVAPALTPVRLSDHAIRTEGRRRCNAVGVSVLLTLVHSPLVGPATWETLADALRARGYVVAIPDLTGTVAKAPPYWPQQVETVANIVGDRSSVLVGHSGAGALLAAVGNVLDHARGYVFVDAGLPAPNMSWLQTAPADLAAQLRDMAQDGWLPPWSEWWGPEELAELLPDAKLRARFVAQCPRLPLAMFEEVLPPAPNWPRRPSAYLRLSDAYQVQADQARTLGWPVIELAAGHLAMLTAPELVMDSLLYLVEQLER
jgi:hypothetical protein